MASKNGGAKLRAHTFLYIIMLFSLVACSKPVTVSKIAYPTITTIPVVVDTLQATNRHYHIGYPAGITPRGGSLCLSFMPSLNRLYTMGAPPSKLAEAMAVDIEQAFGKNISFLSIDKYTVVIQVNNQKTWSTREPMLLQILSKRLKGDVKIVDRHQVHRNLYNPPWRITSRDRRNTMYLFTSANWSYDRYLEENVRQHRVDFTLPISKFGELPDYSGEFWADELKGTVSAWIVTEVEKLPGVDNAGILGNQLYAWVNKAFDKIKTKDLIRPVLQLAQEEL